VPASKHEAATFVRRLRAAPRLLIVVMASVTVLLVVAAVAVSTEGGPDRSEANPDRFEPPTGSEVAAASVRRPLAEAIAGLLEEPFVRIEAVDYRSGNRSDVTATVDVGRGAVSSRERISRGAAIGDPPSESPTVFEYIVLGTDQYLRILQPGQDPATPFQVIDASGTAAKLAEGAYTVEGRIFDSLDVISRLVQEVPFRATRLEARSIDGLEVAGVGAEFSAHDVADFLATSELETIGSDEVVAGATAFEFWYSNRQLVQLVATGTQFHDGEAISDVGVRITYRAVGPRPIVAPINTVP